MMTSLMKSIATVTRGTMSLTVSMATILVLTSSVLIGMNQAQDECQPLAVSVILAHPYVIANDTANTTTYEGFLIDILDEVFAQGNCTYDVIARNDSVYGKLSNGEWSGIIGEVQRQEVDIGAAPITVTQERDEAVDFTHPFRSYGASLLLRRRRHNQEPKIENFQDFLNQQDIKIGVLRDSPIARALEMSRDPVQQEIWSSMTDDLLTDSNHDGVTRARNYNDYAFLIDGGIAETIVRREPCDLFSLSTNIYRRQYSFAVQNQSPLRDVINSVLIDLQYDNVTMDERYDHWLGEDVCASATRNITALGLLITAIMAAILL